MKKRKKLIIVLGIFLVVVVVVGISLAKGKQHVGLGVATGIVQQEPMKVKVFATGRVKAQQEEQLFAPLTGIVKEVLVEVGDVVESGQVLARFDTEELSRKVREAEARLKVEEANLKKAQAGPREEELSKAEAKLEQAKTNLANARLKLERTKSLVEAGAATLETLEGYQQEVKNQEYSLLMAEKDLEILKSGEKPEVLEALQAQKLQAEASLEELKKQLSQGELKAPAAGTILEKVAAAGQFVNQGSNLITIGDLSQLIIEVDVVEGDSGDLALGQQVEVTGTAFSETYEGEVIKIAPVGKLVSGNQPQTVIPVEIALKGNPPIKPGVTAEVNIITINHPEALVLPYEAVLEDEESKEWVFVVKDGKVSKRAITLGVGNELYREVLDGVSVDEEVILNPSLDLEDGEEVKVLPQANGKGR